MNKILKNYLCDERGEVTVEMVILIASAVLMSIAAMIVFAPGLGTATGYNMTLLDLDREGVENPACRYVRESGGADAQFLMNGQENTTSTSTASISCEDVDDVYKAGGLQTFQASQN